MIYLGENFVGFDAEGIGFPSIDGCHAVVVQTDKGLFGYHNFGGSDAAQFAGRAQALAQFITGHAKNGTIKGIYGVCFHKKRPYTAGSSWDDEMKAFAQALGYTGDMFGFDLSKDSKLGADSCYVEYRLKSGKVSIEYKRHVKTEAGTPFDVKPADLKFIKKTGAGYVVEAKGTSVTPYGIIATKANKGEMHAVTKLNKIKA